MVLEAVEASEVGVEEGGIDGPLLDVLVMDGFMEMGGVVLLSV